MALGQPGSPGPRQPRIPRQSVPQQKPAPIHDGTESSAGLKKTAVYGAGLLMVLGSCWAIMHQYNQITSDTTDARSLAGRYDFAHAFALTGVPAATVENNMRLRSVCSAQLNQNVKTRRSEPAAHDVDTKSGALKYNFAAAGEALNCLLLNEQSRLCEAGERQKMVTEITGYIERFYVERSRAERVAKNPMARTFALVKQRMEAAGGDAEAMSDDITSNSAATLVSERLIEAITWVSEDGYLSAADFGRKMPAELAPHFKKSAKTPCKS